MLEEENQKRSTYERERKIVNLEQSVELERLAVSHDFAAAEDNKEVHRYHESCLPHGRERRLALDKLELVGMVAHQRGPKLVEGMPAAEGAGSLGRGQSQSVVATHCGSCHEGAKQLS